MSELPWAIFHTILAMFSLYGFLTAISDLERWGKRRRKRKRALAGSKP